MRNDAAEFDRRQRGIRPYSERERLAAMELRRRWHPRTDRIISAFEVQQSSAVNGGIPAAMSRANLGGAFAMWGTFPTKTVLDVGPWAGYQIKARGSVPDHPITGIGMTALTANTTGTTGAYTNGADTDGDSLIGTCDTGETCIVNMGTFSSSQCTRTVNFYAVSKVKPGTDIDGITALWPMQLASVSNAIVADPANSSRNIAGIVYRAGTANWHLYSASNADANGDYTDTGVVVSASTLYICELFGDASGIYARISTNSTVGNITSYTGAKLPATTTALVANAWGFLATGATRTCRWYGNSAYSR